MTQDNLLDTDVISATASDRREVPEPAKAAARRWIIAHQARLFLPVTAIAEIASDIGMREAAGATGHANMLADWLRLLLVAYPGRALALDAPAALRARSLMRAARMQGITPGFADPTIACIAGAHGLVVATRNGRDFAPMGIATLDPFAG